MHLKIKTLLVSVIFLTFFNLNNLIAAEPQRNIQINQIIVKNNQRIDTETILSYLNLDTGDKVNYNILNKKLKQMYKLGLFSDIKFRVSNNNLIVLIQENPMINNINFIGNKHMKDEDIKSEIKLRSRNVYQKKELQG